MQLEGVPNTGEVTLRFREGSGGGESVLFTELLKDEFDGNDCVPILDGRVERGGGGGGVEKS